MTAIALIIFLAGAIGLLSGSVEFVLAITIVGVCLDLVSNILIH